MEKSVIILITTNMWEGVYNYNDEKNDIEVLLESIKAELREMGIRAAHSEHTPSLKKI